MTPSHEGLEQLTVLQRAVLALKSLRSELDELQRSRSEPIAITGMACRFPGAANTPEAYWEMLAQGTDAICEVPGDRWNADNYYDVDLAPGTMNTRWGGFMEDVDQFDPGFFDLAQREAACMDPQQRILLEVAWEAFERSGIATDELAGSKTGVFIGMCSLDYGSIHGIPPPRGNTGVSLSIAANRLSYFFDLTGPSFVVDTACSASLLSVHLACQSLRSKECDQALAGGVSLMLSPTTTVSFAQAGMMAPDGRCKTFDARADGYTRGEGCGLVVLKRLSDAQREGDRVLGVILGSATNQDGRSNGLTAPCGKAQIRVIRKALESANVQPTQISYVETHGTGTTLGDAVEVASLAEVLSNGPGARQPCILSAVKTNIGHLESAAGVAALIKVVLALQHNAVAPVVHFQTLSPKIDFGGVPFVIPRTLQSWTRDNGSRYAGISGFSFGGANVHLIVGDPPDKAAKAESSTPGPGKQRLRLLPLSAKSAWSLKQLASRYAEHLANSSDVELEDVCYTASTHRSHFSHRLTVSGRTSSEIAEQLHSFVKGEGPHENYRDSSKSNGRALRGFLFTGSAIDAHHLALDLFETEPRFRQILEEVDMALRADEQGSVLSVLYPELSSDSDPTMARSSEVARFCVEYALAQLCQSWGIHPTVVAGQGAGAYLAACVGGALSFADALKIAFDATLVGSVVGKPVETRLVCGLTGRAVEPGEVPGREWFMEANAQVDVTGGLPVVALNNEVMWLRFGMGQPVSNEKDTGVIDLLDPQGRAWPKLTPAVATLYREGARIKWAEFNKGFGGRKTSLPTYPFQRRRCWLEPHEIRAHIEASRL